MLPACDQNKIMALNHGGIQFYCVISNKYGMPKHKYIPHIYETCFWKISDKESLKKGLGLNLDNRYTATKQFQEDGKKFKQNLIALTKQNRIL